MVPWPRRADGFLSHKNTESDQAISGGVGMQPDIIHSDDFEAIFGLYRSENMGFQSQSNDEGGRRMRCGRIRLTQRNGARRQ